MRRRGSCKRRPGGRCSSRSREGIGKAKAANATWYLIRSFDQGNRFLKTHGKTEGVFDSKRVMELKRIPEAPADGKPVPGDEPKAPEEGEPKRGDGPM